MSILDTIYQKSPNTFQVLFLNLYASKVHLERYGKKFDTCSKQFDKTQWYSYGDLVEFQNEILKKLIKHCFTTVPYYHKIMTSRKLTPEDIKNQDDLHKLPILTKNDVRKNMHDLISKGFRKSRLIKGHTSGTTGSPLEFFWDQHMCLVNNVVDWRQKRWAGLNYGDKYAVLLGRMIVPPNQIKPPFWRMNYLHNQLWLSSFHMTVENLPYYFEKLQDFQPNAIEGYPSTVYILAKYLESRNKTFPLTTILTSSETLLPAQRLIIEKAFNCKVFDFYGLAERCIFATECDKHDGRHLNMDYGITEIINNEGEAVERGKLGWMVGTALHNYAMPFIRYKTNDVSSIEITSCPCGKAFPLIEDVTTKAEDIIITKEGRLISPSVLTHPFKPMHNIEMSQIIQEDEENIIIKIVRRPGYSDNDTKTLLVGFQERVGFDIKLHIEFVESIDRTSAGKFRWVISKVPLRF